MTRHAVQIDEATHRLLRQASAESGTSYADLVRAAVRLFCEFRSPTRKLYVEATRPAHVRPWRPRRKKGPKQ